MAPVVGLPLRRHAVSAPRQDMGASAQRIRTD